MITLSLVLIHLNHSIPGVVKYTVSAILVSVAGFVVTRKSHA
jgi:hypothetical protein